MRARLVLPLLALVVAGCAAGEPAGGAALTGPGSTTDPLVALPEVTAQCAPAFTTPTLPAEIPGEAEVDPETGLHVTGTPLEVDPAAWRLEVTGRVEHPLSLTYDQMRCLPAVEASPVLDCTGFFQDRAVWRGVPLGEVLALAGLREGANRVRLVSADGYALEVDLSPDTLDQALLALEVNGSILPALHGFPLRFVWPGHEGFYWVKWLTGIEVR